jgi:hypothetical protein
MKKVLFVLALILAVSKVSAERPEGNPTKAKTNQIEGIITDHLTGEALVGVCLKLQGSDKKTYTDLKGNFKIEGVTPGSYDIDIDYISYKDITLKNVSASTTDVKLKVELESAVQAL